MKNCITLNRNVLLPKSDSGVNSVDISAVESLPESTVVTTPHPKTKFIMDLRITNRIYHDSLNDQESEDYKSLRQEVEQLVRVFINHHVTLFDKCFDSWLYYGECRNFGDSMVKLTEYTF